MSADLLLTLPAVAGYEHICMLQLNRPAHANAYNTALLEALLAALRQLKEWPEVRALLICGAGERAFCAGADRHELKERRFQDGIDLLSRTVFDQLAALPLPTVACINGAAMGGGLELALACDARICSPHAVFALPELSLDLTPAAGGMRRLPALVGLGRAKEMILFQRRLDALEACNWGLVAHQGADYQSQALAWAARAAALDPLALRLAKQLLDVEAVPMQREFEAFTQALLYERNFQRVNT
ncbi:enoyl-CoA hydratase-related protein [Massilia sp. erpn]|uniref:enoyl-CoA hydratase-related protein n=1 Tax=Massilia sp. erpn TaxID=2738142 RepID=UPI0021080FCC|nr:enoyl-CoA hydratase-related protein [Massilia sp. erpn]UTY56171.1 enoyl-CoA hydratase [Massilia sp. erpn]